MEYTKYTVSVGLLAGKQLYLSQRINTPNFSGKWQFPGGKLEQNENPREGGTRELSEETGLEINPSRLNFVERVLNDPTTFACYVFFIKLNGGEIPQRTENTMTDWQLFTFDEALKLDLMPGLAGVIEKLKQRFGP